MASKMGGKSPPQKERSIIMPATKDGKTWRCQFYYEDWKGERHKKNKRGFRTKAEANEWERDFRQQNQHNPEILFENFVTIYLDDMSNRLRETTMRNKKFLFTQRIIPYFKQKKIYEIKAADIRLWQNDLIQKGYAQTYLKAIHNQLASLFNYAEKYYNLKDNPCRKAGSMGKSQAECVAFWTRQEFEQFLTAVPQNEKVKIAFLLLYWTGMRIGELLALTYDDIDTEKKIISITKSCQRIDRQDVITPPKTPKSNRNVTIPSFLSEALCSYYHTVGNFNPSERIFLFTKSYMEREFVRISGIANVQRIRLHDLRHSHASLLIEMGFQPLAIAERLGHERIETTLNTYSHLYPNKQQELAEQLDEIYREK